MNDRECRELDWLAFQYVAGELSADEAELFEQRLENDQSAREAVAGMVQVTQAVASLSPRVAPSQFAPAALARTTRRRASWLAPIVAAAGLAFTAGLLISQQPGGVLPEVDGRNGGRSADVRESGSLESGDLEFLGQGSEAQSARVTALWMQSKRAALLLQNLAFDADADAELAGGGCEEDVNVPGWMIAAVATPSEAAELLDSSLPQPLPAPQEN